VKARVLFLCSGNSCRSRMAEGWARHLAGLNLEPASAGIRAFIHTLPATLDRENQRQGRVSNPPGLGELRAEPKL